MVITIDCLSIIEGSNPSYLVNPFGLNCTLALFTMNTQKYNGWTNYETWLTNLHFDNFDFEEVMDIFDDCQDKGDILNRIEDYIKDYVEDYVEQFADSSNHFIADLIGSALSEIDYRDIAEHYIDDVIANHHTISDVTDEMYGEVA